jgi:1-acyl-sn-glycerol-3-phosphate acyltransferase
VGIAKCKLNSGENVLIFPEGTRNQYDLQLDFKRGASNMAVISEAPILPLVTCCMPRALGKGQKWYQLPNVKSKIVIQFHPVLQIENCIDTTQPRTKQYRELTVRLREYYLKAVAKVVDA